MWMAAAITYGVVAFLAGVAFRGSLDNAPEMYDSTTPDTHVVMGKTIGEAKEQAAAMFPLASSIQIGPIPGRPDLWKVTPGYGR